MSLEVSHSDFDKCFRIYSMLSSINSHAVKYFEQSHTFRNLCLENMPAFQKALHDNSFFSPLNVFESIVSGEVSGGMNRRLSVVFKEINPLSWCSKWVEMRLMLTDTKDKSKSKKMKQDRDSFVDSLLLPEKLPSLGTFMNQSLLFQLVRKLAPCIAENLVQKIQARLEEDLDDILSNVDCRPTSDENCDDAVQDLSNEAMIQAIFHQYQEHYRFDDSNNINNRFQLSEDQLLLAIIDSDWKFPVETEAAFLLSIHSQLRTIEGFVSCKTLLQIDNLSPRRTRSSKPKRRKTSVLPSFSKHSPIIMGIIQNAVLLRVRCIRHLLSTSSAPACNHQFIIMQILQVLVLLMSSTLLQVSWPHVGNSNDGPTQKLRPFDEVLQLFDILLTCQSESDEKKNLIHSSKKALEETLPPADIKLSFQKVLPNAAYALEPRVAMRRSELPGQSIGGQKRRSGTAEAGNPLGANESTSTLQPSLVDTLMEIEPWELLEGVLGNPLAQVILNESEFVSKSNLE